MSIAEQLDKLSNTMNNFADSICGHKEETDPSRKEIIRVYNSEEGSMDGLGNLELKSCNSSLTSPGSFFAKYDTNRDKLATNLRQFIGIEKYAQYLRGYVGSVKEFTVTDVEEPIKQLTPHTECFKATTENSNCYIVYVTPQQEYLDVLLNDIISVYPNIPYKKVAMGYLNPTLEEKRDSIRIGMEIVGALQIQEINEAIEHGYKRLMYISLGYNTFTSELSACLNKKYRLAR